MRRAIALVSACVLFAIGAAAPAFAGDPWAELGWAAKLLTDTWACPSPSILTDVLHRFDAAEKSGADLGALMTAADGDGCMPLDVGVPVRITLMQQGPKFSRVEIDSSTYYVPQNAVAKLVDTQ